MWEKPGIVERMAAWGNDIKGIFREFDRDGSGAIDSKELQALLSKLGQTVDDAQLSRVMEAMDTSGDGLVTLDELTTWWVCMQRRSIGASNAAALKDQVIDYHVLSKDAVKELRKLFNQFDTDNSGSIDSYELKHLLHRLGYNPSDAERNKLMDAIDTSGDGHINVDEFIAWWRHPVPLRQKQCTNDMLSFLAVIANSSNQSAFPLLQVLSRTLPSHSLPSAATATRFDLSDVSVTALRNKLVDFRYNWTRGPVILPPPDDDVPVDYGGLRKFGTVDVSHTHPSIVDVMRALIDDVVLITPLMLPDAAQRIQKMFRAKLARTKLVQALNQRCEIRFSKPMLLGHHDIPSPRSRLREKHANQALLFRRNWMVSIMQSTRQVQTSPTFRTAAFYVYQILCNVKARWQQGVWHALAANDLTLAQLVVRHYPRQLKKPGAWGDLPLHYAIRHRLDMAVVQTFLLGNVDVVTMTNASGHTPLHLACRDHPTDDLVQLLLDVPHGTEACSRGCTGTLQTPLHVGVRHRAPLSVLRMLVEANTSALTQRNQARNTPFHEALTMNSRPDQLDMLRLFVSFQPPVALATMAVFESAWPLHIVLQHNADDAIVRYVLSLAPQAIAVPFRQLLPLFLAMKYRRCEGLIQELAHVTVAAIQPARTAVRTPKRFNPVHYALLHGFTPDLVLFLLNLCPEWASEATYSRDYPLHIAAATTSDLSVVKKLLLVDPMPARAVNAAGRIPLHLAVVTTQAFVKKLLQVCPWSLLDKITGTKYDALMLAAKATARFPNEPVVDALLMPPKLAPTRPTSTLLALTPYYVAATSQSSRSMACFDKLHVLDTCTADDLEAMARKKMRQAYRKPTDKWELRQILTLMALNPVDSAIQTRSLLAINDIVRGYDDVAREACLETYDIVRTLQHTMYDFTSNPRIQILGQKCLHHLLPTAFAKAKYQSRIDPLYKF
ncbi:hypothetical protein DYB32_001278 [Aphanomyces invadans]|uniref:EF-hand domain-containing protein n=1 Tax=Aphanomyces invadans TaxID=157072 RepID=A0A418B6Y8_9STRA|nr:hypothetical protein DYB32_001278 [Aphanomyces invadans]